MACTYQIGRVKVHLVSDGVFWTDGGANFGVVPRTLWEKVIPADELNRIPLQLRCLLIESEAGLILVDTGYGDKLTPRQQQGLNLHGRFRLGSDLASLGYKPEDVAIVLDTHLHGDHAGGNTKFAEDPAAVADAARASAIVPAFPNATYMAQRLELADATYPNERTRNAYFQENFLPLSGMCKGNSDAQLQVLHGDTQITSEVRTLISPGHTRAHQVVLVESAGESAIFLADAIPWAVTMEKLAWVASFDVEPLVSMETKRSLRDWAWRKEALLFFQHDPTMGAGRLEREGNDFRVVKVE